MSHPAGLPDLFIDRSLGRIQVPEILRGARLRLRTLAEVYGVPADENVDDVTWIERAGVEGWAVFMKDVAIATNPAERAAVQSFGARCFALANARLPAHRQAAWFLNSLDDIALACGGPGGVVYAVEETAIRLLP